MDASLQRLSPHLQEASSASLWLADEHSINEVSPQFKGLIISNRYDVCEQFKSAGLNIEFSDFDFSNIVESSLEQIFFRVCKEKPIVHWLINNAAKLLKPGGQLILSGEKNEGIKTYVDKAAKLLGEKIELSKSGPSYLGIITFNGTTLTKDLDDKNYAQLREITCKSGLSFISKPGVFGWDKEDQGSAFLIEHLPQFLNMITTAPEQILDLGCGYGYLSISANAIHPCRYTATDSNQTALSACRENFKRDSIQGDVIADDCASQINGSFDAILCNPPFHQGFHVENDLTRRFLQSAARLLKRQGLALFVVNQFIPLEKKAAEFFPRVETLASNGSFKLVVLGCSKK